MNISYFGSSNNLLLATINLDLINANTAIEILVRKFKRNNQLTIAINLNCPSAADVIESVDRDLVLFVINELKIIINFSVQIVVSRT